MILGVQVFLEENVMLALVSFEKQIESLTDPAEYFQLTPSSIDPASSHSNCTLYIK